MNWLLSADRFGLHICKYQISICLLVCFVSKYANLDSSHHLIPVAVETSGVFGPEALSFIQDLSRHLRQVTGEPRSLEYLLQRISVTVQQGNAAAVLGTMGRSAGLETSFG